ncbi:MAG: MBL fold metallo-hydrolase [Candidatus Bathyarchaeota archaeon]|nr:MBL fold metallo-hydrolase [Candidatus Bathyarchaeota archaeon]
MFFRQVKHHGDNFSYIIADQATREAVVVDSSFNADEILRVLKAEGFTLKYIISTHGHSDHTAGNFELKAALGGQIVAHGLSRIRVDLKVEDGDILKVGGIQIPVIYTPGHTADGICLLVDGEKLLTGDTLFVGECGRTDLPGGNPRSLYDSLFNKLLRLNDAVEVYPGHDYGSKLHSTVGEERRTNYVLQPRSVDEFVAFMQEP